jgi:adenosine deaminase
LNRHPTPQRAYEFYQALPKVDLHRHLEGSLRLETLVEVARAHGIRIMGTDQLRSLVQVNEAEPFTFQNFLSKFATLRLFYRSPEIIGRITREAIADAAADNVRYLELRFTPVALSRSQDFSLGAVMDWVLEGTRQGHVENQGISTRLIVSFNRHESVELAEQVTQLAVDHMSEGVVGLDVAGNEAEYPVGPFQTILSDAKKAGLCLSVHAGEWGGPENVAEAIVNFKADRIGHGVRVMEDEMAVSLASATGIPFEVCVTSNHQSGVVPSLSEHPLPRMLAAGLNVTINTDDPRVSQITLSNEYRLVCEELGIPLLTLRERVLAAAQASFLPPGERQRLVDSLNTEFNKYVPLLPGNEE